MTLFSDARSFISKYLSNPLVAAAVAYIIASLIKKHAKKTAEAVMVEGSRYAHTRSGTVDVITDKTTGKRAIIKGTDITIESMDDVVASERIKGLHERWFKELSEDQGQADKGVAAAFPMDEFAAGLLVETEHTSDPIVAARTVLDHLAEDKEYYTKLKSAGL
jgi:hypothetical protein